MNQPRTDLPQGTLDLLVLVQVAAPDSRLRHRPADRGDVGAGTRGSRCA